MNEFRHLLNVTVQERKYRASGKRNIRLLRLGRRSLFPHWRHFAQLPPNDSAVSADSWQWWVAWGPPAGWKGVGERHTRWDVITPCNFQEIQGAAGGGDESASSCSPSSWLLARKGSGRLFRSLGVPQGLVLGPSETGYRPGAMFFPQGVVEQTDSQPVHSRVRAQPASTQISRDSF